MGGGDAFTPNAVFKEGNIVTQSRSRKDLKRSIACVDKTYWHVLD